MRISELSARSQVPIPTIKYYLREGLLPQGEQTSATRAVYGEDHLRRLRLIRALIEVGRLPVAAIRKVVDAVQDEDLPVHDMLGTAHYALGPEVEPDPDEAAWRDAGDRARALADDLGWAINPNAPTLDELAQSLLTLERLGMAADPEALRPYARAAHALAEHELAGVPFGGPRDAAVEHLVIGTVLYGRLFDVLRRLAQESESSRLLGPLRAADGHSE
ncbi:MerR family transcriptional regulator [Spongiactinospora gelatinilytica]|uniref:MerR family transcriptional regulator n=1 Tax=Spongiactinospora gelatinilytica TaxID=2666298 RepID=A0A2W2FAX9_9ACTN|nr:MerR family transcriptional regulator [Spongiactinospora gelatinilytica]PZG34436.1 MerR family transcriptional regulator [Spongiactinospora gelatinilytica]